MSRMPFKHNVLWDHGKPVRPTPRNGMWQKGFSEQQTPAVLEFDGGRGQLPQPCVCGYQHRLAYVLITPLAQTEMADSPTQAGSRPLS